MKLTGIPETLVMPLWARAAETAMPDGLFRDPRSVEMVKCFDYDFSKFNGNWRLQLKVAIRTSLLDRAVQDFLARHPTSLVVNIGAGLDTRFARLDNQRVRWIDLDVHETITVRRRFFEDSERNRMIECSVFDDRWFEAIDYRGGPLLFIAEGVLPYFSEVQVRQLLEKLARTFPGAEMLLQTTTSLIVARNHRDATDKFKSAKLYWGIESGKELTAWKGINLLNDWVKGSYCRSRWRGWWWLVSFPPFARYWHNRIVHIRFTQV
nr:class I SAM-dependent methyltransferase [uncultured Rhodoferax sp.]